MFKQFTGNKARNKVGWEDGKLRSRLYQMVNLKNNKTAPKISEQCISFSACEMAKSYPC